MANNTLDAAPIPKRRLRGRRRWGAALRRESLAAYLDTSTATIDRWDAAGLLPRAIKIGGVKFYTRKLIDRWLALNAPPRDQFEMLLQAKEESRR
jgi:predicted DNA-binding transcriptional regulator AlpA